MTAYTFQQLIDFTRTSAGTFVGSNGLIQNTPASVNLLTWTQEFDNAAWTKAGATSTANSTAAPDGTPTADTLTATAGASTHNASQAVSTSNSLIAFSIYAKAGTHSFIQLLHTNVNSVNFNLSTGAVGTVPAGMTASITAVGDGWYRCSITMTPASTASVRVAMVTSISAAFNESWTATGTETVFLWGAQLEQVPDANITVGSELAANGTFDTDTAWTKGTGWSIASGAATKTAGTAAALSQNMGLVNGRTYRIILTLTATAGSLIIRLNDVTPNLATLNTSGTYTLYLTANGAAANGFAYFHGDAAFAGSIDNVSVREVTAITGMPSDYTRNVGGLFPPRFDFDPVTLAPRGILIEEQRTNLFTYSAQFDDAAWIKQAGLTVTANTTVAPDGTTTADTVTNGAGQSSSSIYQNSTLTNAVTYTVSYYVRAGTSSTVLFGAFAGGFLSATARIISGPGSISGTSLITLSGLSSTEWTRVSYTVTGTGALTSIYIYPETASGATGKSVIVWGAQLEAGAFATSYIPTVASQVTRTADQASIVAPMFAPWYNQSEGTFVAEYSPLFVPSSGSRVFSANDGTGSNRIISTPSLTSHLLVSTGGVGQVDLDGGTPTANAINKVAATFAANNFAVSLNGGAAATDTSGTVPTVNQMSVGNENNSSQLNGHVRRITYFPTRLSNAQLQALTA